MGTPLTALPDERVSQLLVETFNVLGCVYNSRSAPRVVTDHFWPSSHFASFAEEIRQWAAREAPTRHPILRYYLATGDHRCMQVTDVPARFADRHILGGWRELGRHWGGVGGELAMPIAVGSHGYRAFILDSVDTFGSQAMTEARRIQRLLMGLDRQMTAFSGWAARTNPRERVEAARFTPRELAVLDLLARGMTAAAIGRRLAIAERTVQKHLQHVYAKLRVTDRLSAVQRAQMIGILPRP
jgi:DNA-binding CsgD family transcriptional regulator